MRKQIRKYHSARLLPLVLFVALAILGGCAVGPNYKKPSVNVPQDFRGVTSLAAATPDPASLGDQKWTEVFRDQQLQELVRTALKQDYDVRIAASRIIQAQAQLGIT